MRSRDQLTAQLESAKAENLFTQCAQLGRKLKALNEISGQLQLSEDDFCTLATRRSTLESSLQELCRQLVGLQDFDLLEQAAALLETVGAMEDSAAASSDVSPSNRSSVNDPAASSAADSDSSSAAASIKDLESKVVTMQEKIDILTNSVALRDKKIRSLNEELRMLRASPLPDFTMVPENLLDPVEWIPERTMENNPEDYRWL
jgi:hypothetical protein